MPDGPNIPKLTTDLTWTPSTRPPSGRPLTRFDVLGVLAGAVALAAFVAPSLLLLRHAWPEPLRYLIHGAVGTTGGIAALTVYWAVTHRGHTAPLSWIRPGHARGLRAFHCGLLGAVALLAVVAASDSGPGLYWYAAGCVLLLVLRWRFDMRLRGH